MSYVTAIKAKGEQAGIYVTTPGRTNGLSGCNCNGVCDFMQLGDYIDAGPRRVITNSRLSSLSAGPTYAPGGRDLGVPLAAGATWFGIKPRNVPVFQKPPGLSGLFDTVFSKLGLLDVISQEYPGMTMAAAYRAEKGKVDEHKRVLAGLRSATARSILARQISDISGKLDSLGGAMEASDSQIGKREKDAFADAILAHRSYTKDWRDAKAKFGYSDPGTGSPEEPAASPSGDPTAPASPAVAQDLPWKWIVAGGILAVAAGVMAGKSKRRSA